MKSDKVGFWQFIKMLPRIRGIKMRKVSSWGDIKKKEEAGEGKTLMEWFEMSRTEDWMHERHDTSKGILDKNEGLIINVMMSYIQKEFPESFSNFISNNQGVTQAAHNFAALMFHLGFAKGAQVSEDKVQNKELEDFWGKE